MSLENIQKVVGFGLAVGESILEAMNQTSALAKGAVFLKLVEQVPDLIGIDYSALAMEAKSLTPDQLDQLNKYIDDNFKCDDQKKEALIEDGLSVVVDLVKLCEKAVNVWDSSK